MGTRIFLGEPPANIKAWIIEHYAPEADDPSALTIVEYSDKDILAVDLKGEIDSTKLMAVDTSASKEQFTYVEYYDDTYELKDVAGEVDASKLI